MRVPVVVSPMATVIHDGHPYSMPPDAIGIAGTLFLYRDRVRIVAGRFDATHPRLRALGSKSTLPEHRAQQVAAVSGKRAKRYLQREHLLELGGAALEYLTELTHRRPRVWLHDVDRLHALLTTYGEQALRGAFAKGLAEQAIGSEYTAHYLATLVAQPSDEIGCARSAAASAMQLTLDLPSATAWPAPRAGRVQVAEGARPGDAERSTWTPPSTARRWAADGAPR